MVKKWREIMHKRGDSVYRVSKIQGEWLPIPAEVLSELGWDEGTEVEIAVITGNQIVVRRKDALKDA